MDLGLLLLQNILYILYSRKMPVSDVLHFRGYLFHHTDKMGSDRSWRSLLPASSVTNGFFSIILSPFPVGDLCFTQWYFYALSMHIYQFLLILQDNLRKRKEACKGVQLSAKEMVLPYRLLCLVLFLMNVLKIAKQSGSIQLVHTYHTHDIGSCCCLMASCIGNDTCGNNGQITRIDHIAAL